MLKKFFYSKVWGKRFCPYPFNRLEVGIDNNFIPCCHDWIKFQDLPNPTSKIEWNGAQALLLRQSMFEGSFKYCKREKCHAVTFSLSQLVLVNVFPFLKNKLPYSSLSMRTICEIFFQKVFLSDGPKHLNYTADLACNLKCPSCRDRYITNSDHQNVLTKFDEFNDLVKDAETILFAGGEAFYSVHSLKLLRSLNSFRYPKLKEVTLMTNGLLLNKAVWESLGQGSKYIRRLMISIDAGTMEHYQAVRGGDWDKLLENLHYVKILRESNKLDFVSFQFVPRKDNFRSMDEFVSLAQCFNVDRVLFQTFCHWNQSPLSYEEQAVHRADHPLNQEFLKIASQVKKRPKVIWAVGKT